MECPDCKKKIKIYQGARTCDCTRMANFKNVVKLENDKDSTITKTAVFKNRTGDSI